MRFSVVIPTFNRAGKVLRAVDSVLRQSFAGFELIVVDDGSTDDTSSWISQYDDPRLKYFQISQGGVAKARNYGVYKAIGDWLLFLDSDDVWRRHKLSEQIRYHQQNPDCVISQTDDAWIRNSIRVNKSKKYQAREGDLFRENLSLCLISCSSVMIRRDIFENAGGFNESFPTCEDYDLWLRLTAKYPVGFVAKPLVTKFGGHADQLSKAFPVMDSYRVRAIQNILASGILSEWQERTALAELEIKRKIIDRGKLKRSN